MRITNLPALQSLQDETMVYAAIVGAVALGFSFLVASLIAYKGGNDRSYITRRIWYVIIGLAAAVVFYIYNDLFVKPSITNVGWQSMFSDTNIISIFINLGVYLVGGVNSTSKCKFTQFVVHPKNRVIGFVHSCFSCSNPWSAWASKSRCPREAVPLHGTLSRHGIT